MVKHTHSRKWHRAGFTLIEALVSLVIFGILTVSLSLAFSTALRTQRSIDQHQEETGTVRAVFDVLTHDLSSAYGSSNNTQAIFTAGGSQGSANASSGGLLTFMTRAHRILNEDQLAQTGDASQGPGAQSNNGQAPPQSETVLVRYDFDPQAGTLSRTVDPIPNIQALGQMQPGPDTIIARQVVSISLRFWDTTQQSWRTDWDYEQQNQQSQQTSVSGSGSASAAGGSGAETAGAGNTAANNNAAQNTGDTALPGSVEITLELLRHDGTVATYTTSVPVVTPQPVDTTQPPVNTSTSATGGTPASNRPGG